MENLVIYLIKSSTLLLFFFTTYYFLLKKETFFTANRWFLIVGIFCSALLPLLSFQKIVWLEPVVSTVQLMNIGTTSTTVTNISTLEENAFSWEIVLIVLYCLGVFIFLSKLIIEFYSLKKVISTNNKRQSDGFEFIEVNHLITPFSFFNKIVYNPNLFQAEELENIIEHEKIHAKQLHSVDVLIARIYCILFWWNPIVWFYKKAMIQNLEFIADQNALAKAVDKKSYLLTLLKITTAENPVAITNHFYQSLIKKRIVMLHTNQSKKYHSWKYFIVLPALVFFMLTYQIEVVAQEKKSNKTVVEKTTTKAQMTVSSSSTDEGIYKEADYFKKEFGILMKFKTISRNKKGEITSLSVTLSDKKGNTKVYDVSESEAIKPFTIFVNTDENGKKTFGFGGTKENQHLKQHFEAVERNENNKKTEGKVTVNEVPAVKNGEYEMYFKTSDGSDNIALIKEDRNTDYKKAVIILNDKVISATEMEQIDPLTIGSVTKLSGINNDKLVAKYGENARNGVILIATMEYEEPLSKEELASLGKNFKIDAENGGFTIHKRSQKSDLESYQKYLKDIGVNAKISGIERNREGFITAIKIKLVDEKRNHKMSENWITSKNPNGIPDISIGRKKGKLSLNAN